MTSQILVLRQRWQDSVNSHDINRVLECYNPEAIFKGTVNADFTTSRDHIRVYFENIFKRNVSVRFIGAPKLKQFGDVYIDYGDYEFCIDRKVLRAKYTFSYTGSETPRIICHTSYKTT